MAVAWRHSKNVKFGNIRQKIPPVMLKQRRQTLLNCKINIYNI